MIRRLPETAVPPFPGERRWEKQSEELVVAGEWAFERYSYRSTDTPKAGGDPLVDTGWGLLLYHRDADGVWRVARDAFGSDQPAVGPVPPSP